MASHPHHHCNNHRTAAVAATCSCCCSSCSATTSPLPLLLTDPLLQALASQILLQQSLPQNHSHFPGHLKPQHHHKNQRIGQHQYLQDDQAHTVISSLFKRIDALESSLKRLSSSSSSSSYRHKSSSIRDIAARTIQIHFRAFLVRRSRTLGNLKNLALIKSDFIKLKSSISDQAPLDTEVFSRRAMDFLIELDSIQGGDPMIRDGKRSISRDLVRFLNFIDGVSVRKHDFSIKTLNNVKFVQNKNKSQDHVRASKNRNNENLVKKHGVQSGLKKCVGFVDAEKKSETEDDDDTQIESGESDQTSDSEGTHIRNSGAEGINETNEHYSPPAPVKMESRTEILRKERLRKIGEAVIDKKR